MSSLAVIDQAIESVRELMKAPPGPKPLRFGDDVGWNEQKRRWMKMPQVAVVEKPSKGSKEKGPEGKGKKGKVTPSETPVREESEGEEISPTLGRVRSQIDWISPVEKFDAKGVMKRYTLGGLPVPPAWTGVGINKDSKGNWQAIGVDAAGRTVALPHPNFVKERAKSKFNRGKDFARQLPSLRKQLRADFGKVEEAQILSVIDATSYRIGGTTSDNFGITTLQGRHVSIKGNQITFDFIGKKGQRNHKVIESSKLARMLAQRKKKAGANGELFAANDGSVRRYLNGIGFSQFTPKDFRTHAGTELAKQEIRSMGPPTNEKEYKKFKKAVGEVVGSWLNNTAAIALGSYVDPGVFRKWERSAGLRKAVESWINEWILEYDLDWEDYSYHPGWDGVVVVDNTDE